MSKVYSIITERIIANLEKGVVPWEQPWVVSMPKNMVSKRPYSGMNVFLLNLVAIDKGYKSNYWLTYKQAQQKGGFVRKGEHPAIVTFVKWTEKENDDGEKYTYQVLRYYNVFNVEQCEFENPAVVPVDEINPDFCPIEEAQNIVENMPNAPAFEYGGDRAVYAPKVDTIGMPHPEKFVDPEAYYSVLFHEMAHSTGHYKRLGRFPETQRLAPFGSEDYSKEELIAEMTAAMLCGVCGIENATVDRSAAYIDNWLGALKSDMKFVVNAASQAQKAADYILGVNRNDGGEE